jgi:hypothetical protein
MKIVRESISVDELQEMAATNFSSLVKAVVDIERELLAVYSELHSDLEGMLLEDGSKQLHLWGINLYPAKQGADFIEYDSMINVRPSHNNFSRGVDSEAIRGKIIAVVEKRVAR